MYRTYRCVAWIVLLAALACLPTQTSKAQSGDGDIFVKAKKLGRGVNLGNFLEVPRDGNWAEAIKVDHLPLIKKAGFDSIRMPIKWSDYAAADTPYTIEEDFAKRVDSFLAKAEEVGLNVVLNIHHYDGLDQEPDKHQARFAAIWKQLGNRYKDRGDWLYFELHNEPHDKLDEKWNEVLKVGLAAVRESNPTRAVVVGPINYNGIWKLPTLVLPEDPNIIVTVHMYNPFPFTHQGATWTTPAVRDIKDKTFGSAEEIAAVKKELQNAADWGKANNRPIFVGEFGAFNLAPQESRVKWTETIARTCESLDMPWAYWEFCAGFGIYDLKAKAWREDLLHALIPPQTSSNK